MIPILYDSTETAFTSNGLGRLRDCISCVVTEERNGVYECDFEYPIDGINYNRIQLGRIIAVKHEDSSNIQPFDIVSYSRPINGVVTFHCVHISYRQTALTVSGSNINSLADAFTMLGSAEPQNPFTYWTDKTSTGFLASGDSVPHTVRQILGGMEGSILDAYGGEYEWDKWTVKLWSARGSLKNFTIRYGVNLIDFSDEMDYSDTYNAVIPYWIGQDSDGNDIVIKGDIQTAGFPAFNQSDRCIPLNVTDKFDSDQGQPTKAQVEEEGLAYIQGNQTYLPSQTIKVDFIKLADSVEYSQFKNLQTCRLCDSINVEFPRYNMSGQFKIVKTVYDVLKERYSTIELGGLSVTLSEALGINQDSANRLRLSANQGIIGEIKLFAGNNIPNGWLECDGSPVLKSSYPALFNAIGNTWGTAGDADHFILPDLSGRVPVGRDANDTDFDDVGNNGGTKDAIVPYHNHTQAGHSHSTSPQLYRVENRFGSGTRNAAGTYSGYGAAVNTDTRTPTINYAGTSGNEIGANLQPYAVVRYIICAK